MGGETPPSWDEATSWLGALARLLRPGAAKAQSHPAALRGGGASHRLLWIDWPVPVSLLPAGAFG